MGFRDYFGTRKINEGCGGGSSSGCTTGFSDYSTPKKAKTKKPTKRQIEADAKRKAKQDDYAKKLPALKKANQKKIKGIEKILGRELSFHEKGDFFGYNEY